VSGDAPLDDSNLSDDQVQLLDWDAALAQGEEAPVERPSGVLDEKRLARQIRCMKMLRQAKGKHIFDSSKRLLRSSVELESRPEQASDSIGPSAVTPMAVELPGFTPQVFPITLGKFELREEIGRGGYGVVFLAYDRTMGRELALKVPHASVLMRDELLMRFHIEARAAGVLDHPNIVQVYDAGSIGPVSYIASAYCPGTSLHDWLAQHSSAVTPREAAQLVMCLARAIQHANERGVFHRDLKPANILLQASGGNGHVGDDDSSERRVRAVEKALQSPLSRLTPRITDFGLAKLTDETLATVSGSILGTPAYMAPEQASGQSRASTSRVDVYSLGAVLYQLLTGVVPFEGPSPWETLRRVVHEIPAAIRTLVPGIARDLETICLKCLEKEPQLRYASAAELADDLQRFLNHEPILARSASTGELLFRFYRRKPLVSSLALALVLAICTGLVTVFFLWKQSEARRIRIEQALVETAEASQLAQQQQKTSQRLLYLNSVSLAEKEVSANLAHARDQLVNCRPELRDWEWDYLWKRCHPELLVLSGHKQAVRVCRFSPEGGMVASGSGSWGVPEPGEVLVRDTQTGKVVWQLGEHLGQITGLAFHPTRNLLASCDQSWRSDKSGCTHVWDLDTGKRLVSLRLSRSTYDVQFDPTGEFLATAGADGRVRLFRTENWRLIRTVLHHRKSVHAISFHPSGELLASAGRDGRLCVFEIATGKLVYEQDDLTDVRCVSFSPDGSLLACSTFNGNVLVWQTAGWQLHSRRWSPTGRVGSLEFSPNSSSLLVSTVSGTSQVWDVKSGQIKRSIPTHYPGTLFATFNSEGDMIATCGSDSHVKIWSTAFQSEPNNYRVQDSFISDVAVIPGSNWIACGVTRNTSNVGNGDGDYAIRIVDRTTGKPIRLLKGHTSWTTRLDTSPDGRWLVSASLDGSIRLWDPGTGECLRTMAAHDDHVTGVAFVSANNVVSSGRDAKLKLWDPVRGQLEREIATGNSALLCVAATPVQGWIATADEAGNIDLWNWRESGFHLKCEGLQTAAKCLSFSDDGMQLAAGGQGYEICLWDIPTTDAIATKDYNATQDPTQASLTARILCRLPSREVRDIQFLPTGNRLAYASTNFNGSATVRMIDSVTGEESLHLIDRDETASSLAYHPEHRELILAVNSNLLLHSTSLPSLAERWETHRNITEDWHVREANLAELQQQYFALDFHLSHLIQMEPENAALYQRRANAYAAQEKWQLAESDFVRFAELTNNSPDAQFNLAILHLARGNSHDFHIACEAMIGRLATSSVAGDANTLAWILSLTSQRLDDMDLMVERARYACDSTRYLRIRHISYNTLGLALYRAGKYDDALATIHQSIELKDGLANDADCLVLAMIYQALGNVTESARWFEIARRSLTNAVYLGNPVSKAYSRNWINRFQMRLLLEEAQGLLENMTDPAKESPAAL